ARRHRELRRRPGRPEPRQATTAGDRERARAQLLTMLAEPRVTGMTTETLDALRRQLAPAQAAQAEQRKFQQRGRRRLQAPGAHGRPLLSDADRVLVTLVYLRGVCPQKVLADLLGTNPATIGEAVRQTRLLLRSEE